MLKATLRYRPPRHESEAHQDSNVGIHRLGDPGLSEAAHCFWMFYTDPFHRMGMGCWLSQLTGLPCDYGTFGLLALLAVAGLFIASAASNVIFMDRRG